MFLIVAVNAEGQGCKAGAGTALPCVAHIQSVMS